MDKYEDDRFKGCCPTCGQRFYKEVFEAAQALIGTPCAVNVDNYIDSLKKFEMEDNMDLDEFKNLQIEKEINSLSHYEMCRLARFAPVGHKYFDKSEPYWGLFKKRFEKLGGFTPEISKDLG